MKQNIKYEKWNDWSGFRRKKGNPGRSVTLIGQCFRAVTSRRGMKRFIAATLGLILFSLILVLQPGTLLSNKLTLRPFYCAYIQAHKYR